MLYIHACICTIFSDAASWSLGSEVVLGRLAGGQRTGLSHCMGPCHWNLRAVVQPVIVCDTWPIKIFRLAMDDGPHKCDSLWALNPPNPRHGPPSRTSQPRWSTCTFMSSVRVCMLCQGVTELSPGCPVPLLRKAQSKLQNITGSPGRRQPPRNLVGVSKLRRTFPP